MWKVLVAHAEQRERASLRHILCESGRPLEVVAEAADGAAALMLASIEEPDLFVIDSELPDFPALELLQRIRRIDDEAAIIVLAGADGMDAARETVARGASDYILKPVDPESLQEAVDSALSRLRELRDTAHYSGRAREEFARALPLYREDFLRDLVRGRRGEDVEDDLEFLRINLPEKAGILILKVTEPSFAGMDRTERVLRLFCLKAMVRERFPQEFGYLVFDDGGSRIAVIGDQGEPESWLEAAREVEEKARRRFGMELDMAQGCAPEASGVAESYSQLLAALDGGRPGLRGGRDFPEAARI